MRIFRKDNVSWSVRSSVRSSIHTYTYMYVICTLEGRELILFILEE